MSLPKAMAIKKDMTLDFTQNLTELVSTFFDAERKAFDSIDWVLLSNGLTEFDENIIFFGFDGNSSVPIFVAKVPRLPSNIAVIQTEYQRLREMWERLGDDARRLIPQPIALSKIYHQPVLITSYVNGESLARLRITTDPDQFLKVSLKSAKTLRYILDKTMTPLKNGEIQASSFFEKAKKFKQMYPLQEAELKAIDELQKALRLAEERASHCVLTHGDYWHGNIIFQPESNTYMLVDWQYSCWTYDASLDVYLFLLAGALATVPNIETPQTRAQKAAQTLVEWKGIIKAYLSEFGAPQGYSVLSLKLGMLLCCVDKGARASLELGFDREEDLVWFYFFRELFNLFENNKLDVES